MESARFIELPQTLWNVHQCAHGLCMCGVSEMESTFCTELPVTLEHMCRCACGFERVCSCIGARIVLQGYTRCIGGLVRRSRGVHVCAVSAHESCDGEIVLVSAHM